jgi:hypothetical protein
LVDIFKETTIECWTFDFCFAWKEDKISIEFSCFWLIIVISKADLLEEIFNSKCCFFLAEKINSILTKEFFFHSISVILYHLIEQTYFFNHSEIFNIGGVVNASDIKKANFTLMAKTYFHFWKNSLQHLCNSIFSHPKQ